MCFVDVLDLHARAQAVIDEMLAKGLPPNEVSFNTLVNGWVKKGIMDKAQRVVDEQMIARGLAPNEVSRAGEERAAAAAANAGC
jgi:pentatricopeptide repeat protein